MTAISYRDEKADAVEAARSLDRKYCQSARRAFERAAAAVEGFAMRRRGRKPSDSMSEEVVSEG